MIEYSPVLCSSFTVYIQNEYHLFHFHIATLIFQVISEYIFNEIGLVYVPFAHLTGDEHVPVLCPTCGILNETERAKALNKFPIIR